MSPQLRLVSPVEAAGLTLPAGAADAVLTPQECDWAAALPPGRRRRYERSRRLLRQLLAAVLKLPPQQLPLHSPPGAPPRLPEGLGWVSLSHAADALLVAWSPNPVGVDLEWSDRRFDAPGVMRRFFPEVEQRQLAALAVEPLRRAVLRSWVCKEAAIKWRQRGLAQELCCWSLDHQRGLLRHGPEGITVHPCEGRFDRWSWAAVGPGLQAGALTPVLWSDPAA